MKSHSSNRISLFVSIPAEHARVILFVSVAGLLASLIAFAVLVNAMAGEEYGMKKLSSEISRQENEIARSQALLLKGSLEGSEIVESGSYEIMMQDIGSDLHYLHANATFVEAPKPTP